MNHVSMVLSFLVLLSLQLQSSCGTSLVKSSSSISISSISNSNLPSERTEKPAVTVSTRSNTVLGRNRVVIQDLPQKAFYFKRPPISWDYLENLEDFNAFLLEEREAVEEIFRLGIRIIVTKCTAGYKIRYRRTFTLGVQEDHYDEEESDYYDEFYVIKILMNQTEIDSSFWKYLEVENSDSDQILAQYLERFISQNNLLRAMLILKKRPNLFNLIKNNEIYSKYIFTANNTQSVLKHLVFDYDPKYFMQKFLEVYGTGDVAVSERLATLFKALVYLGLKDEKVQEAFDFANKVVGGCPIQILATFVDSKRPLKIDQDLLERILFDGTENVKERVTLLKLSEDSKFIESVVLKCFSSANYSRLVREILFDRGIVKFVSVNFTKKFLNSLIAHDRFNTIKFLLTTGLMTELKKEPGFGSILAESIEYVGLESFKILVKGRMIKTNVPIFNHESILKAAYRLIKLKEKPLLLEFLVKERLIAPTHKVTLKNGKKISLLAVAARIGNYDFINLFDKINWDKCEDVLGGFAISDENMRTLLESKGAKFSCHVNEMTRIEEDVSPVTTKSPDKKSLKRSFEEASLSNSESTFETPEKKIPKFIYDPEDPESYYEDALKSEDQDFMLEIITNRLFKYSYENIIWDLVNNQMEKPLNHVLSNLPKDSVVKVVNEAAAKECEYVIYYLFECGRFDIKNDRFDGLNLIAFLLKNRKPEFALKLIELLQFDMTTSHNPEINPEGDILFYGFWNADLADKLLEMGASPNVTLFYEKAGRNVTLKQWAEMVGVTKISRVLEKYHAK